ncbi:hypothetical protein NE237_010168 [Protea cynaroides]|uniref:Uncharacterized protein n=1 Tax=Protea cynaroides TaxID=273540 RepID=A0A9Q0KYU0_9MAGN|nr:hypothetical protein NE237_010168 [Protea cynaroides]
MTSRVPQTSVPLVGIGEVLQRSRHSRGSPPRAQSYSHQSVNFHHQRAQGGSFHEASVSYLPRYEPTEVIASSHGFPTESCRSSIHDHLGLRHDIEGGVRRRTNIVCDVAREAQRRVDVAQQARDNAKAQVDAARQERVVVATPVTSVPAPDDHTARLEQQVGISKQLWPNYNLTLAKYYGTQDSLLPGFWIPLLAARISKA